MNEAYTSFDKSNYARSNDNTTKELIKKIYVSGYDDGYQKGLNDNLEIKSKSKSKFVIHEE